MQEVEKSTLAISQEWQQKEKLIQEQFNQRLNVQREEWQRTKDELIKDAENLIKVNERSKWDS